MKQLLIVMAICISIAALAFTTYSTQDEPKCVTPTLAYVRKEASAFAYSTSQLADNISKIKKGKPQTIAIAKEALKQSRLQYKNIEFFLTYFLRSASLVYNEASKNEVEEPFMEYREPTGFQVIEDLLFSKDATLKKEDLVQQAALINTSARDITSLLYDLKIDDRQILESIRLELIRLTTLGILGYDAPQLKSGIEEAGQVLVSVKTNVAPLLLKRTPAGDSVSFYLNVALQLIKLNDDFNSFERLHFLTEAILPLQYRLGQLIKINHLELNTTGVLNYNAKNIFSSNALRLPDMIATNETLINLGRKLFFDKSLSKNLSRSCATCHQPDKYFTDGLAKSKTLDGSSTVKRNTPTLFYSSFQYSQFWDGRVKSLNEQIKEVLSNATEMGDSHEIIISRLTKMEDYKTDFAKAFQEEEKNLIDISTLSTAITAFLQTLSPMNSAFDSYMNGDKKAMNAMQIKGFDLFMGKAQCGTCHFTPLFNGLVPPLYNKTELEVLGVTKNTQFAKPVLDKDEGRFTTYPIPFYKGAFKTPTVRNIAKTAPYMHNGAFSTLESVLEFYNKGGASGMGLKLPLQTLSSKPLQLTKLETKQIISFLHSLTDLPVSAKKKVVRK